MTPPTKEQTDALMEEFDGNHDGTLNRLEFHHLAAVLCQNVATRVALQTTITMVLAPLLAAWIVSKLSQIESLVEVR